MKPETKARKMEERAKERAEDEVANRQLIHDIMLRKYGKGAFPRSEALDSLDHLACKLDAVSSMMDDRGIQLNEEATFGLYLIFQESAGKIRHAKKKLEDLIPVT